MKKCGRNCVKLGIFLLLAIVAWGWLSGAGFLRWSSVCSHCGALRRSQTFLYMSFHSEHATPLSQLVHDEGLVPEHEHEWLFAYGSGGAIKYAWGPGHTLLFLTGNKSLICFLRAVKEYRGIDEAKYWAGMTLDQEQIIGICYAFATHGQGFQDAADFEIWFAPALRYWQTTYGTRTDIN